MKGDARYEEAHSRTESSWFVIQYFKYVAATVKGKLIVPDTEVASGFVPGNSTE